ncbi:tumor necrosis factor receptor superfamily member 18 isoform X2 [Nycticebus coucang]|uniref:tumor necrosis factor receptor superfamily member 18 isoform X2 n=1 Tax=Nycticebus coucang TaxID=9470 RepID=UPI00234C8598|nr:tumor necrosis factor receptor superfamily member 18 isoform X2 [Nycticebus coucang]
MCTGTMACGVLCHVVLLCALGLGLGQHLPGSLSCGPRRLLHGTGTDARCCRSCTSRKFTFGFKCVDCAVGTFSGGQEGRCKPWADCPQFGFLTTFPGNKTHDTVCIPEPLPTQPYGLLAIVLLAVATCILVLTTAQLGLHIWQLKRERVCPRETQRLLEVLPQAEDTCSCQFPEEEHGERLAEEKGRLGDLWV